MYRVKLENKTHVVLGVAITYFIAMKTSRRKSL